MSNAQSRLYMLNDDRGASGDPPRRRNSSSSRASLPPLLPLTPPPAARRAIVASVRNSVGGLALLVCAKQARLSLHKHIPTTKLRQLFCEISGTATPLEPRRSSPAMVLAEITQTLPVWPQLETESKFLLQSPQPWAPTATTSGTGVRSFQAPFDELEERASKRAHPLHQELCRDTGGSLGSQDLLPGDPTVCRHQVQPVRQHVP